MVFDTGNQYRLMGKWDFGWSYLRSNALSELCCPYMICVDTTVTFLCLIVWKICRIRSPFFVKWPPKWRIDWHDVFGNTFSGIYATQNLYIESTLKALRLLVSEIDVLLWKWLPFYKMAFTMSARMVWYISQYFSEIYASQNLYIQSKLKVLRLLVSEIAAILENGRHNRPRHNLAWHYS